MNCIGRKFSTLNFKPTNHKKMTSLNFKDTRSGFGEALHQLGKENPNVFALCADLTGSLKMDAFKKEFPERFIQTGDRKSVV